MDRRLQEENEKKKEYLKSYQRAVKAAPCSENNFNVL